MPDATSVVRHAACLCGRIHLECRGAPVRISICHCDDCRRRTGSAFGLQVRYAQADTMASGDPGIHTRVADSGRRADHRFCPACGTTVWWTMERDPGLVVVAGGAFAERDLPGPSVEVYAARRYPWCEMPLLAGIESMS
ncbi:MAG TPA: GFA family protein [Lysobacter sp.]|nr:GFA family protein [Lysobacter sp.]